MARNAHYGEANDLGSDIRDVPSTQMICQHSTQMMQTSFACTICECLQGRYPETIDTPNVDDPGWIASGGAFLEQRSHQLRDCEDTVEVQGENTIPG